jgi:ferredoxin
MAFRLRLDPIACEAHGYCAELLPERITLDEWGYPLIDGEPVGGELVELARAAAAACPRRALAVEPASPPSPAPPSRRARGLRRPQREGSALSWITWE